MSPERIVVQYPTDNLSPNTAMLKRLRVERILDRHLRMSGEGYCDGGDPSGSYFCVVDTGRAVPLIRDELLNYRLLDGAVVEVEGDGAREARRRFEQYVLGE